MPALPSSRGTLQAWPGRPLGNGESGERAQRAGAQGEGCCRCGQPSPPHPPISLSPGAPAALPPGLHKGCLADAVSLREMRAPGLITGDGEYLSGLDRAQVTRKALGLGVCLHPGDHAACTPAGSLRELCPLGAASTRDKWELWISGPVPHPLGSSPSPRIPHGVPVAHSGNLLESMLVTGFLPFLVSLLHPCYG